MADKRQPSRRLSSSGKSSGKTSGKQAPSQRQAAPRQTSSGKAPVSQRQSPIRRPDMIRCENCGEDYSSTYKRCPFCDERPGRTGIGGRRVAGGGNGQVHPVQLVGLVISLVLIIAALFIVFTRIAPMFLGGSSGGEGSSVSTSQSAGTSQDASGSGIPDGSSSTDSSAPDISSGSGEGTGSTSQGTGTATVTSITLNKTDMIDDRSEDGENGRERVLAGLKARVLELIEGCDVHYTSISNGTALLEVSLRIESLLPKQKELKDAMKLFAQSLQLSGAFLVDFQSRMIMLSSSRTPLTPEMFQTCQDGLEMFGGIVKMMDSRRDQSTATVELKDGTFLHFFWSTYDVILVGISSSRIPSATAKNNVLALLHSIKRILK